MKLLKMAVNGLTLFKGTVNIDFLQSRGFQVTIMKWCHLALAVCTQITLCLLLVLMHLERRLY